MIVAFAVLLEICLSPLLRTFLERVMSYVRVNAEADNVQRCERYLPLGPTTEHVLSLQVTLQDF